MTVELLYFEGCPNYLDYLPRLQALLINQGLAAAVTLRRMDSDAEARAERFLGSPTVRIDGEDVEPDADRRTEFGLTCRVYRTSDGWAGYPPDQWVCNSLAHHGARVA